MDVTTLGELLIDFTPAGTSEAGNPIYERNPGGAPANVAAAVARLGGTSAFIGKVGKDSFGQYLRDVLQRRGVDCRGLTETSRASTTMAFVTLEKDGDCSFSFARNPGADTLLTPGEIPIPLLDQSRVFHFGSLSMSAGSARVATIEAAAIAKNCGSMISFDPNYRPDLWPDLETAKIMMFRGLEYADLLKLSRTEMELLTDCGDLTEGTAILAASNLKLIVVTLGAQGCFYRLGTITGQIPTYRVSPVDTTGAGDAFWGAVLYQITRGSLDPASLSRKKIEEILDFANAVGAVTTTRRGGIPAQPSLDEVAAFRAATPKA